MVAAEAVQTIVDLKVDKIEREEAAVASRASKTTLAVRGETRTVVSSMRTEKIRHRQTNSGATEVVIGHRLETRETDHQGAEENLVESAEEGAEGGVAGDEARSKEDEISVARGSLTDTVEMTRGKCSLIFWLSFSLPLLSGKPCKSC